MTENSSYLLNDLRDFNEIFRKDATYVILKVTKKQGFTLSLEDTFFENQLDLKPHLTIELLHKISTNSRNFCYTRKIKDVSERDERVGVYIGLYEISD